MFEWLSPKCPNQLFNISPETTPLKLFIRLYYFFQTRSKSQHNMTKIPFLFLVSNPYFSQYTTQSHTLYCLVMELAEGGELLTYVKNNNEHKRLEESKARPFVRQLISALYYLHSKGVVHR